ncbi:MAG: hypothetical protein COX80_02590 [Candidatus Magasanikbacteria bacterium CG_4_10_14_0_2_um_filter_33_14]|uniref:Fibronectin type-III domain-containing protein n=1 Tax=Candidatus Magasanikbacteria bacterium CG_4_10_14_0_2_um_filter_33_14 TaxID=1974636 RepID=A0A2M7VAR4_9BACT|nr:MAG: hypothetical protein COX80_02590 [Candidatus Magasanikbacteria bacterium CG_4_10_14_0_2_um_filter_33_14]
MRKAHILLASAFALLLVGAGCSNTSTNNNSDNAMPEKNTKTTETTKIQPEKNKPTLAETTSSELTLSGKATDEAGTVSLTWSAPQDLKDKVETWRLLYGKDANPTFPASWYFERGPSFFDKVWSGLPSGTAHIRVCAVVNNECTVFSNDLEVNIK